MEANRNEFIENASKILLSKSEEYKCIIDKIEHYLNELLEDVKGITISGRSKDANNIAEKIYRKNYMMKYNDAAKFIEELPDGIGVRIICLLNQDEVKIYKHLIDRMPDERQIGNKSFRYRQDGNFFVCTENQPEKQKNNLDMFSKDPLTKLERVLSILQTVQKDIEYVARDVEKRRGNIFVDNGGDLSTRYAESRNKIESDSKTVMDWKVM